MRGDHLRTADYLEAAVETQVAHLEQSVLYGAVAVDGHEHGLCAVAVDIVHAVVHRGGDPAAVDREAEEHKVIGGKADLIAACGVIVRGCDFQLVCDELGDLLNAAGGAEADDRGFH